MNISGIIWLREVLEKNARKHDVMPEEVEQVFNNRPRFRFIEKGQVEGEDMFSAVAQTDEGRYLIVYFIRELGDEALIVSAREMDAKERKRYGKK